MARLLQNVEAKLHAATSWRPSNLLLIHTALHLAMALCCAVLTHADAASRFQSTTIRIAARIDNPSDFLALPRKFLQHDEWSITRQNPSQANLPRPRRALPPAPHPLDHGPQQHDGHRLRRRLRLRRLRGGARLRAGPDALPVEGRAQEGRRGRGVCVCELPAVGGHVRSADVSAVPAVGLLRHVAGSGGGRRG